LKKIEVSSISGYIEYIEKLSPDFLYRGVAKTEYLPVPGLIWKNTREHESGLEHDFLVSYKSYIENHYLNSWEIFSLMQNHGLPTRLLDWTESALVGLFFALTTEPQSNEDRVVWVLNPFELNQETVEVPNLFCPSTIKMEILTLAMIKVLI